MSRSTVHKVAVARRPATGADLPLLRELFADARIELAVLPPDTRFVLLDMRFRAQRRQHSSQFPEARDEILSRNGADVGRVLADRCDDAIRVLDLTVSLGHRREGIASTVLTELAAEADATDRPLVLTVWAGNTAMRRVCESAGLSVVSANDGHLTMASRTA